MLKNFLFIPVILTLLSFLSNNIVNAQDFRPNKSDLVWGKDEQGLRMAVWTNPEATKVFAVVRNFSKKKICYCDYVLGNFGKIYARKNSNYEWQEMNFRPATKEEIENQTYIGFLPCSDNSILKPNKEMPPFKSQYKGDTEVANQNYSFAIDLSDYVFPSNLSGIVQVKIVQHIFHGRCDNAFEGDLESEYFNTQVPLGIPTPNNLSPQEKLLIKEKAFEIKKIYNSGSFICESEGWNYRRFYFDYPDKQIVDAELVSLLVGYEKSGFATAAVSLPLQLQSDAVSKLFPNYRFYSICWDESPVKGKEVLGLAFGLYYSLAIDSNGNTTKLPGPGHFEKFGEFLSINKIQIKNSEDARLLWLAFCDIYRQPWHSRNLKQISPNEWYFGFHQTNQPFATEQSRRWYQVILDDKQQVLSAKSMSETVK